MARPRLNPHQAGFSLLEWVTCIAIAVLAAATLLPLIRQTREAIQIEETAQQLSYCMDAISWLLRENNDVTQRQCITYTLVTNGLARWNRPPLKWPKNVDLSSLILTNESGPTVNLNLPSGTQTITLDHINLPN